MQLFLVRGGGLHYLGLATLLCASLSWPCYFSVCFTILALLLYCVAPPYFFRILSSSRLSAELKLRGTYGIENESNYVGFLKRYLFSNITTKDTSIISGVDSEYIQIHELRHERTCSRSIFFSRIDIPRVQIAI